MWSSERGGKKERFFSSRVYEVISLGATCQSIDGGKRRPKKPVAATNNQIKGEHIWDDSKLFVDSPTLLWEMASSTKLFEISHSQYHCRIPFPPPLTRSEFLSIVENCILKVFLGSEWGRTVTLFPRGRRREIFRSWARFESITYRPISSGSVYRRPTKEAKEGPYRYGQIRRRYRKKEPVCMDLIVFFLTYS